MGHVPPRPLPPARPGPHFPRRQHRGAGEVGAQALTGGRRRLGSTGERIACWFLRDHGMRIVARNVVVPGGEIDVVARDGPTLVAIEVRTSTQRHDPIDALDDPKRARVARLGARIGAHRVDLIGIGFDDDGFDVHWVPGRVR